VDRPRDFTNAGGVDEFPRDPRPAVSRGALVRAAFAARAEPDPVPPGRLHELTSALSREEPASDSSLDVKLDIRLTHDEKRRWHDYAGRHRVSVSELVRASVNAVVSGDEVLA